MTRFSRISPAGVPVHVIQRGNNRQVCFVSDEDHGAYVICDHIPRKKDILYRELIYCTVGHKKNPELQ